ncbi:helix-turn-helix domain-containing protein [Xanthomonas campestris]|uniref:helix-turn-helix domain-containing protein n=1 Tax=Xanthomonas campestris TaxID=339 RepID=UPI0027A83A20|nr:helix-turn-helix transcriptional regulator [Xanthomonas campestris pv. incanae]
MQDKEIYEPLGRAIAQRRSRVALTQLELASMIGVSRASIANTERGRQTVSVHNLYAIAQALQVDSLAELLPPLPQRSSPADIEVKSSYESINASEAASVFKLIDSISKTEGAKVRK